MPKSATSGSSPTNNPIGVEVMKTTYAVILCVLLLLFSACATKMNDPADVQAIKKSMDDYAKAVNAGNVEGVVALMTDKATYAGPNDPVATGKEAIRSMHTAWLSFAPEFSCPVEDVRVVGDLAVARGTWTNIVAPKAQGIAPSNDSGSWIVTLARQSDGSWKWDWCLPNSNQPLPGSTASGEDEKALLQIERDWAEAIVKKDTAVEEKLLANDFVSNIDGLTANKKQFLAGIKANPATIESAANSEMKAFVFGDAAVVNGVVTVKASAGGKDTSVNVRYTDVFVKRDGRWQYVTVTAYSTKAQ
jgi:uncharacterized protein (TIGR02246 family)